jgi:hypothetical protein
MLAVRSTTAPIIIRQVVLVTTQDRLQIPPIQHFRDLIHELMVPRDTVADNTVALSPRAVV